MASRVTFQLEEQTALAVREEELRTEYARAADNLRAELSAEAAQHFQYLEQQQNIFAQARLRTVESALGTEYVQTAQRDFSGQLSQERDGSP